MCIVTAEQMAEAMFECTQCSQGFIQSCDLSRHMMTHTGEKPYECTQCGKGFSASSYLVTHMRTHTGDEQDIAS